MFIKNYCRTKCLEEFKKLVAGDDEEKITKKQFIDAFLPVMAKKNPCEGVKIYGKATKASKHQRHSKKYKVKVFHGKKNMPEKQKKTSKQEFVKELKSHGNDKTRRKGRNRHRFFAIYYQFRHPVISRGGE